MKLHILGVGALLCAVAMPALASDDVAVAPAAAPVAAPAAPAAPVVTPLKLTANTPIELTLNSALSSRNSVTGDKFSLTVAQDVMSGNQVVIPKGARAIGLVNFAKGNGSFGKSGKIELKFKYIEFGGKQIPLDGIYYQEGAGNTAGTVGAVFAAGVIGGLVVKGHSADIPAGKDFNATLSNDVPFLNTGGAISLEPSYTPEAVSMQTETEKERKARMKAAKKAG